MPALFLLPILTLRDIRNHYAQRAQDRRPLAGRMGQKNLIAASGVSGNATYFGLPIITALFGAEGLAIYLFAIWAA